MCGHPGTLEIESEISGREAPADDSRRRPVVREWQCLQEPARPLTIRPLPSAGSAKKRSAAALPGRRRPSRSSPAPVLRLGVLDGRPFPGLDRRCLCQGRQHHDCAEGVGLYRRGACRRQRAGQGRPAVLARIDDRDYRAALDQANADVAAAKAAVASKQARLTTQQSAHRRGAGDDCGRSGEPDLRRTGKQALFAARHDWLRQRAERAAGGLAHRNGAGQRSRATSRRSRTATRQLDVLKAELAQAQATVARDMRWPGKRPQSFLHRRSCRRSMASSATAPCASANTCRRARS